MSKMYCIVDTTGEAITKIHTTKEKMYDEFLEKINSNPFFSFHKELFTKLYKNYFFITEEKILSFREFVIRELEANSLDFDFLVIENELAEE